MTPVVRIWFAGAAETRPRRVVVRRVVRASMVVVVFGFVGLVGEMFW
jgi:hypothetical protein